jgi:hypothetical protein
MSREKPRSEAWAEYYQRHPEVAANWNESNGYPPNDICPMTGRSAGACDTPDHRNCPDLRNEMER